MGLPACTRCVVDDGEGTPNGVLHVLVPRSSKINWEAEPGTGTRILGRDAISNSCGRLPPGVLTILSILGELINSPVKVVRCYIVFSDKVWVWALVAFPFALSVGKCNRLGSARTIY